ncbi:Cytochrome f [Capsicum baccatum]|uniref:Cytochrome f n=1 Tax=Capsicum baccatum TaxID=33114 RepID=A0A2G2XAM1_CAPBA|nr:Cytochrome f [Capsicum baccatum]
MGIPTLELQAYIFRLPKFKGFELAPLDRISPELKEKIGNLSFQSYRLNKKKILVVGPVPGGNREGGQIYPDGSKSKNTVSNATAAGAFRFPVELELRLHRLVLLLLPSTMASSARLYSIHLDHPSSYRSYLGNPLTLDLEPVLSRVLKNPNISEIDREVGNQACSKFLQDIAKPSEGHPSMSKTDYPTMTVVDNPYTDENSEAWITYLNSSMRSAVDLYGRAAIDVCPNGRPNALSFLALLYDLFEHHQSSHVVINPICGHFSPATEEAPLS